LDLVLTLCFSPVQDELDSRAARISDLESANTSLLSSIDTLKSELVLSHSDLTSAHSELELLRSRALDSQKSVGEVEVELRELREQFEHAKVLLQRLDHYLIKPHSDDPSSSLKETTGKRRLGGNALAGKVWSE
jgi:chromosome segregation ATPase